MILGLHGDFLKGKNGVLEFHKSQYLCQNNMMCQESEFIY